MYGVYVLQKSYEFSIELFLLDDTHSPEQSNTNPARISLSPKSLAFSLKKFPSGSGLFSSGLFIEKDKIFSYSHQSCGPTKRRTSEYVTELTNDSPKRHTPSCSIEFSSDEIEVSSSGAVPSRVLCPVSQNVKPVKTKGDVNVSMNIKFELRMKALR